MIKKRKPSAGLTKKQRSNIVKKVRAGKDMGKTGKDFKKVYAAAYKFYRGKGYSVTEAKKIARATAAKQMWRVEAKKRKK